jgi:hypothetical protein
MWILERQNRKHFALGQDRHRTGSILTLYTDAMADTIGPKTKSGAMRIGLVPCPACANDPPGSTCSFCENARFVAVDRAIEFAKLRDTDPAPPPSSDQKPPK